MSLVREVGQCLTSVKPMKILVDLGTELVRHRKRESPVPRAYIWWLWVNLR